MPWSRVITASRLTRTSDEDLCSQVNHMWTVYILVLMALGISAVQYVGQPIHCWCPAQMPEAHCNYTTALCWVKSKYYVDEADPLPVHELVKQESEIAYYPWVPWILFVMAACFKLPHMIWNSFMPGADINMATLITKADSEGHSQEKMLAKIILVWLIRSYRGNRSIVSKCLRCLSLCGMFWLGRHQRTYLTGLSIIVKCLYLFVAVAFFFLTGIFLDQDFIAFGYDVIESYSKGATVDSPRFPKATLCDIEIRQMNNIHKYTIQCILPVNLYNEKIFIFIWFWLVFMICCNFYSLIKWSFRLLSPSRRYQFINKYLIFLQHFENQRHNEHFNAEVNIENDFYIPNDNWPVRLNRINSEPNSSSTEKRRRQSTNSVSSRKYERRNFQRMNAIEIAEDDFYSEENRSFRDKRVHWLMNYLGHDGVLILHALEDGVGVVVSHQIFQELVYLLQKKSDKTINV